MDKATIVYGPQGVGKRAVAEALAASTGGNLVDEWAGREQLLPGDVAATNMMPPPVVEGALYVEVSLHPPAVGRQGSRAGEGPALI